jgi:murein L,D-transpeptidase YafK
MDAARPESAIRLAIPSHEVATKPWSGVQVVVYKSKRLLSVYRDGVFEKEFRIVLGLVPAGRKRHASDARTPEGLYRVTGKRRHDRWQHFLALDYPNARDRQQYESDVRRGAIPDDGGTPFDIGGDIGIHGNDRNAEQAAGIDWTKGCIAMSAADIQEVRDTVPVGAPVWIVE